MTDPIEEARVEVQPKKLPVCKVNNTFSGVEHFPLFWGTIFAES